MLRIGIGSTRPEDGMGTLEVEELAELLDADFSDWATSLSPGERRALQDYQEGWSKEVNEYLRGDLDPSFLEWDHARRLGEIIEGVESAVEAGQLRRDVLVYR